ncbi:MAG: helix-turn-helix domain-containing protein [Planctomycetota bacterium]|nr:helix-turn-helix domain-containing protein [Planctomycetota bacterium]
MAGMFYSLQEAIEKLSKTEEEIKQLIADGKLREFRDGANLLFKVEEVEALMAESSEAGLEEIPEPEAPEPEALEPEALEPVALESDEPELGDLEPETLDAAIPAEESAEPDFPDLDVAEPGDSAVDESELEVLESEMADAGALEPDAPSDQDADIDEILLAPETGAPAIPSDLTDADTAITSFGTNVLGETGGTDYDITDDTMAETAAPMGGTGTTPDVPLEEIEEDVNLDSFGSGSGLLDLSLQADDTSLGGILDEIYTSEDEFTEPTQGDAEPGSAAGLAAEAEEEAPQDELPAPQMAAAAPALARPFMEMAPDSQSNTLGMLLFLPLLIVIYTTVVAVSGLRGVMPSILTPIQGLIWYIMGGAVALTAVVAAVAFLLTGERDTSAKRAKKPKKAKKVKAPKKPKEKKPKKPKKEKKAKKAK